jgi:hypothetical protein
VHSIDVCAETTTQPLAVNDNPLPVAYRPDTTFDDVGPRFVPVMAMRVPPTVGIDVRLSVTTTVAIEVIDGAMYDVVAVDNTLACPPTVTIHL